MARGGPQRGIGGGLAHHVGLNKLERLAGPSVPAFATPYSWLDLTPRFLKRAGRRDRFAHSFVTYRTPSKGAAVFLLHNDSKLLLGPTKAFASQSVGFNCRSRRAEPRYFGQIAEHPRLPKSRLKGRREFARPILTMISMSKEPIVIRPYSSCSRF